MFAMIALICQKKNQKTGITFVEAFKNFADWKLSLHEEEW